MNQNEDRIHHKPWCWFCNVYSLVNKLPEQNRPVSPSVHDICRPSSLRRACFLGLMRAVPNHMLLTVTSSISVSRQRRDGLEVEMLFVWLGSGELLESRLCRWAFDLDDSALVLLKRRRPISCETVLGFKCDMARCRFGSARSWIYLGLVESPLSNSDKFFTVFFSWVVAIAQGPWFIDTIIFVLFWRRKKYTLWNEAKINKFRRKFFCI